METPQTENGYTAIANEIIDNFQCLYLTSNEWKILWVVLRKTYGWKKKEDRISISQFQSYTKLSRPNAHRAIKSLVAKSLLVAKPLPFGVVYSFNKVYSDWTSSYTATSSKIENTLVAKSSTPLVAKPLTKLVAKSSNTKEKKTTITKTTIQKKEITHSQKILSISLEDKQTIAERYRVPLSFVESKQDDLLNWYEQNPQKNRKENWLATLRGWVKRDALQVVEKFNDKKRYTDKYKVTKAY